MSKREGDNCQLTKATRSYLVGNAGGRFQEQTIKIKQTNIALQIFYNLTRLVL
jgi:hypothetical protein